MATRYRDHDVRYRQPGELYRGTPEIVPGIDMDRFDNVQVRVVDQYGQLYGELPAANLGPVEWVLNDGGSVDVSLSSFDPFARDIVLGEREVQVVFNDSLDNRAANRPMIWWGTHVQNRRGPGKLVAGLSEVETELDWRLLSVNKDYDPEVEQIDIAADLIDWCQTGPNMDLNITVPPYVASGRERVRHYAGDQFAPIRRLLHNFNGLIDGFDWHMEYDLTGQRLWIPDYPQRGVHTNLIFEWGKNIVGYDFPEDAKSLSTRHFASGGTDGAGTKLVQSYEDIPASERYGVRETASSEGDNNATPELLLSRSQYRVENGKQPLWSLSLAVWEGQLGDDSAPTPVLGNLHPGDWAWVTIDDGANQVDQELRCVSIKWLPQSGLDLEFSLV